MELISAIFAVACVGIVIIYLVLIKRMQASGLTEWKRHWITGAKVGLVLYSVTASTFILGAVRPSRSFFIFGIVLILLAALFNSVYKKSRPEP